MAPTVKFGANTASNVVVVNDTTLTATVPSGTGIVDVSVSTLGGTDTDAGAYTYVAAPVISALTPASGPEAGGNQVTITGSGFSA
jgi:hypothetical protein